MSYEEGVNIRAWGTRQPPPSWAHCLGDGEGRDLGGGGASSHRLYNFSVAGSKGPLIRTGQNHRDHPGCRGGVARRAPLTYPVPCVTLWPQGLGLGWKPGLNPRGPGEEGWSWGRTRGPRNGRRERYAPPTGFALTFP